MSGCPCSFASGEAARDIGNGQRATSNGQRMTEPPPILKTWPRLYAAVLLALALEVVLFYALTRAFA